MRSSAGVEGDRLDAVAIADETGRRFLAQAAEAMRLSARGCRRVMRVAPAVADLAGGEGAGRAHIAEALGYRRQAPRNRSWPSRQPDIPGLRPLKYSLLRSIRRGN